MQRVRPRFVRCADPRDGESLVVGAAGRCDRDNLPHTGRARGGSCSGSRSRGRSVGGLQREQFRLYDEGKLQPITDFSVDGGSAGVQQSHNGGLATRQPPQADAEPQRFIAYVFDDRHISFQDLEQARRAFESHLSFGVASDTRAAVVSTTGSTLTPYTSDREVLLEAARRIRPGPATHTGLACPEISYYMADLIINRRDTSALNAAVRQLGRCGPPVPHTLGDSIVKAEAARILRVESEQTIATLKALEAVLAHLTSVRGRREIIIVSKGFSLIRERAHLERILARAIESGIVISAINAHGVHSGSVDASNHLPSARYTAESLRARSDALSGMAETTGGRYLANTNDIRGGLRALADEPEHVYLLSFAPQSTDKPGRFHKLKVEVAGVKNAAVQARRGYFTPHLLQTRELPELIQTGMASPYDVSDLSLQVTADFQDTGQGSRLRVNARIGATGLGFRECEDHLCNALTIVYGLFDANGVYIAEVTRRVDLRLAAAALKKFGTEGIQLSAEFAAPEGSYAARVVVVDDHARKLAAVSRLVTQEAR